MHEVQEVQKEEDAAVDEDEEADDDGGGEKEEEGGGQARVLHFPVCSLAHPVLKDHFFILNSF